MESVHKRIRIRGKVQGVYFRASARDHAITLNLKGLVRNDADGSVYVEVEGAPEAVDAFLLWCSRGPERATVRETLIEDAPPEEFTDFRIQR